MPLDLKKIKAWVATCDSVADAAARVGMQRPNLIRLLASPGDTIQLRWIERFADVMGVEPAELIRRAKIV